MKIELGSNRDMEQLAKNMHEWLVHVVAKAEERDPKLKELKNRVNLVSEQVRNAQEAEFPELFALQTEAIQELINHVSSR